MEKSVCPAFTPHDLTARAFAALDARLDARSPAPVCVAVSGGGDSMALMTLACDWAKARGRKLLALSVDHGLQAESAAWSRFALEAAAGLGARTRLLTWEGGKPTTGLPAAARAARHALLAEAAREAGAGVILLAHTADDIAEAAVMRAEGSNLGDLRDWSPSPAWPEGRDVFLLRPLLGARRAELRAFLRGRGLGWIEDPANADTKYARSRARAALNNGDTHAFSIVVGARPKRDDRKRMCVPISFHEPGGGLALDRLALAAAPPGAARRFLSAALLSAAGTARPPRRERLDALLARLRGVQSVAATLAGARIAAQGGEILIAREMPRGGLAPMPLSPGGVSVWDGRWEIAVNEEGFQVVAAAGRMAALTAAERKEILGLAQNLRGSQPLLIERKDRDGKTRPVLARKLARVRALAGPRLRAACGLVAHERDIVAPERAASYIGLERPPEAAGI